jgi:hypothetical protein
MEQTPRRGRRLSILGIWEPDKTFEYALAVGSFKGPSYIKVMDWLADKAAVTLEQTGRLTVVVGIVATAIFALAGSGSRAAFTLDALFCSGTARRR